MATMWIMFLAVLLTLTSSSRSEEGKLRFTTVPPEQQEKLESDISKGEAKNLLDEGYQGDEASGDIDDDLLKFPPHKNKTAEQVIKYTTPKQDDSKEELEVKSEAIPTSAVPPIEKESVGGEYKTDKSSEEEPTESDEGSGEEEEFFSTTTSEFLLDETDDKEFVSVQTTAKVIPTTEEDSPVLIPREKPESRPKDEEQEASTVAEEKKTEEEEDDEPSTAAPVYTTAKEFIEKEPEIKTELKEEANQPEASKDPDMSEYVDVDEGGDFADAVTAADQGDNPSAEKATGDGKISRGAVVGIVIVGVLLLLVLIILLVYLLVFRRRGKSMHISNGKPAKDIEQAHTQENGLPNGCKNEESMSALVKELKDNKLSEGQSKSKAYGTQLQDDMENVKLNGNAEGQRDSSV